MSDTASTTDSGDRGFVAGRQSPSGEWRPFPVETLPPRMRAFVVQTADAIGCDPSLVALPALAAAASAIGNTRRVLLKSTWTEPSVLWTAPVGESGTAKSPAMDSALSPLVSREETRQRLAEDQPESPRLIVSDVTVEALAVRLQDAPRGLLLSRDELAGWLRSFNAYRSGRGGDAAQWLSIHGAKSILVDRKTGDKPKVFVPRAAVSITGGIQPATLAMCLGREHFEDGMAARFLVAMPPARRKRWTDETVDPVVAKDYDNVFDALLALGFAHADDGQSVPVDLPLADDARPVWQEFYDAFGERQAIAVGDEAAALAKLEGAAARLALVHQLVSDPAATSVGVESIRAGTRLALWFADEAARVYGMLDENAATAQRRRLADWIAARGGRATQRDVVKDGPRRLRDNGRAKAALDDLVAEGLGVWADAAPGAKGGRPTKAFVLSLCDATSSPGDAATQPAAADTDPEVVSPSPDGQAPGDEAASGDRP